MNNKQFDKILYEIQEQGQDILKRLQKESVIKSDREIALMGANGIKDLIIYCAGVRASLEVG